MAKAGLAKFPLRSVPDAPPSSHIPDEMNRFIDWYNAEVPERDPNSDSETQSGITRAGIAHLWFELIHPFDDGHGRVGRAIADHALSQSLGYPTTACLATAIEANRNTNHALLQLPGRGALNIDSWLD